MYKINTVYISLSVLQFVILACSTPRKKVIPVYLLESELESPARAELPCIGDTMYFICANEVGLLSKTKHEAAALTVVEVKALE